METAYLLRYHKTDRSHVGEADFATECSEGQLSALLVRDHTNGPERLVCLYFLDGPLIAIARPWRMPLISLEAPEPLTNSCAFIEQRHC